jgi:hypothetical protein
LFEGLDCDIRVIRARARTNEEAGVRLRTVAGRV